MSLDYSPLIIPSVFPQTVLKAQDEDKLNKKHNIIQTVLKSQAEDKQNKKHNIIMLKYENYWQIMGLKLSSI
jgi:hypothetical protein